MYFPLVGLEGPDYMLVPGIKPELGYMQFKCLTICVVFWPSILLLIQRSGQVVVEMAHNPISQTTPS